MEKNAEFWIKKLGLKPHPEGGYYREVYHSDEIILKEHLPSRYESHRSFSTSIYFLLKKSQISKFHRLKSDEIWHFYSGSSLFIYIIEEKGKLQKIKLGPDAENREQFQYAVKRGSWFGAEISNKNSYSLIGCTVAPGFDFKDFKLGKQPQLLKKFPEYKDIIKKLT